MSGKGEGRMYVCLDEYKRQFERVLNFTPYCGTLNVKVGTDAIRKILQELGEGNVISGFKSRGQEFKAVRCYPCTIKKVNKKAVECALLLPFASRYQDVVEVISPKKLRDVLGLMDGDHVVVEV